MAVCVLFGCSFRPEPGELGTTDGAPPGDGDDPPPGDTTTVTACDVEPTGSEADAPFIGGTGGQAKPDVTCAAGELPIGLSFNVSGPLQDHGNQVGMVHLHLRCGRITRGTDGVYTTMPAELVDSNAGVSGGDCSDYFPNMLVDETLCPSGKVLVGIDANRIDSTLYNTVVLRCAALDLDGNVTAVVTTHPVENTGANNNNPMSSSCAAGMVITSFGIRSACGHDQLAPRCSPISCN